RVLSGKSRFHTDRKKIVENAQKPRPRNLPVKTGLTSGLFFDGSGKCLLAHPLVRVTLTNHRRLFLFPTDYDIRHTVVTVEVNSRTGIVSAPGEREVPTHA